MSVGRSHACAAPVGKRLYICAGYGADRCLNSAERYNPETQEWEALPDMLDKRYDAGCAAVGQYLYVFGGADGGAEPLRSGERFDAKEGKWEPMRAMLQRRQGAASQELYGLIYVLGGHNGVESINTVERFNPANGKWEALCKMRQRRYGGTAQISISNDRRPKVFVFGGHDGLVRLSHGEMYDIEQDSWTEVTREMPQVRCGAVAGGAWQEKQPERQKVDD